MASLIHIVEQEYLQERYEEELRFEEYQQAVARQIQRELEREMLEGYDSNGMAIPN
jgi:hypothetical protein